MCVVAAYAQHPDNVALILAIYDAEQRVDRKVHFLRVLAEYAVYPETHRVFREQLTHLPGAMCAIRALCRVLPEEAATYFVSTLDLVHPDVGMIQSLLRGVPLADRKRFLEIVGSEDQRVNEALAQYPNYLSSK